MKKTTYSSISIFLLLVFSLAVSGQVQSAAGSIVTVNFSTTLAGVNNGAYNGTGFTPTPAVGQLDSDAFAIAGNSLGTLAFGGTATTAPFARGSTTGGATLTGIYNFNPFVALGVQPDSNDFNPGSITLRIENTAVAPMTQVTISYNILVNNDQARSSTFNFSHSSNNTTYTTVPALNYTTPTTADANGFVSISRITNISGLSIPTGGFFYIRWSSATAGGTGGSYDEIGLDNIIINRLAPTAALGTISGRARTADGFGVKQAVIMLSGGSLDEPVYATTNQFGYYNFEDIPVGQSYVLQITSGRYIFQNPSRVINLDESIRDEDFILDEPDVGKPNQSPNRKGDVLLQRESRKKPM